MSIVAAVKLQQFSLNDVSNVLVHVPLQNSVKWSKQAHEAISVNGCHLDFSLGDDVGGSWLALQKSSLAEVIAWSIVLHDRGLGSGILPKNLCCNCFTADNDVEIVAFVTLSDDLGASFKLLLLDGISNLAALVVVNALQNRH